MVEATKTTEMTKKAKWAKIKKELLKLPKKIPEIIAISIYVREEATFIITEPIGLNYELSLYRIGKNLEYKVNMNFEHLEVINMGHYKDMSWKEMLPTGATLIYERTWGNEKTKSS